MQMYILEYDSPYHKIGNKHGHEYENAFFHVILGTYPSAVLYAAGHMPLRINNNVGAALTRFFRKDLGRNNRDPPEGIAECG